MSARRSILVSLLVATCCATVGFFVWSDLLDLGLLSDDWLLPQLLRDSPSRGDGAPRTDVDWEFVLRDFAGPWFGTEGTALYRPLVTVSLALDVARGGLDDPRILHATNLTLHVLSTALVSLLAYVAAPRVPWLCGLVAGCFFALHPVTAEPAGWIVARNSGLVVFFMLASTTLFALQTRTGGRVPGRLALVFAILALLTKETAVLLSVWFFVTEVVQRLLGSAGPFSWRAFVFRYLRWAALFAGYLGFRILLFGSITGGGLSSKPSLDAWLDGIGDRLGYVFVPHAQLGLDAGYLAWIAVFLLALALLRRIAKDAKRTPTAMLVIAAGLLACLYVAADVRIDASTGTGTRILLVLLPLASLLSLVLVGRAGTASPWLVLGIVPIVLLSVVTTHTMRARLLRAGATMQKFVRELRSGTDGLSAMIAAPSQVGGVPFINANAIFPIVTPPMSEHAARMIGLNCVLQRLPDQPELYHDAGPLRAVLQSGANLLAWIDDRLVTFAPPGGDALPALLPRPPQGDEPLRYDFEKRVSPFAFEAVVVDTPFAEGTRLFVVGASGRVGTGFSPVAMDGAMRFDIGSSIDVASLSFSGGVVAVEVEGLTPKDGRAPLAHLVPDPIGIDLSSSDFVRAVTLETNVRDDIEIAIEPNGAVFLGDTAARGPDVAGLRTIVLTSGVGYACEATTGPWILERRIVDGIRRFYRSDLGRRIWVYWERPQTNDTAYARSALVELRYALRGTSPR
ncbi:MAG: hypothetical protein H6832_17255 [Planctomycetes bacterium]|nr:hypothetical protein [Planctomycetota bacterium]